MASSTLRKHLFYYTSFELFQLQKQRTDGVPLYPNYDRNGQPAWTSCGLDVCNGHVHDTQDYHYHGDPFGPGCLYSEADYAGGHPPQIGWALDGFRIYGRYTSEGASATGVKLPLDACGGHTHPIDDVNAAGNGTSSPSTPQFGVTPPPF